MGGPDGAERITGHDLEAAHPSRFCIAPAAFGNMFNLSRGFAALHAGVMESIENEKVLKHVGAPAISEVLPRFLEHIRVEEGRVPITIARYRSHIQR